MADPVFADYLTAVDDAHTAPTTPTRSQSTSQPTSLGSFDLGYANYDLHAAGGSDVFAGMGSWAPMPTFAPDAAEGSKTIEPAYLQSSLPPSQSMPALSAFAYDAYPAVDEFGIPLGTYDYNSFGSMSALPPHLAPQATVSGTWQQQQQQLAVAAQTALPASARASPAPRHHPYDRRDSSSGGSSGSLKREGSVSSDVRQPRPKNKLTLEDKKRICMIHREEGGRLRQEDIAKLFSVDRSTISKIIGQSQRFLSDEPRAETPPAKGGKKEGKFPMVDIAIEEWMEEEMKQGREIKESTARERAIQLASKLGYDRFKASSKWFKNLKLRREAQGKPSSLGMSRSASAMSFASDFQPLAADSPIDTKALQRLALSGADFTPARLTPGGQYATAPASSSRHTIEMSPLAPYGAYDYGVATLPAAAAQVSPSSGKAPRASPLVRQKSYNGSSTTPTRPTPLSRANSTQGRPSPHHRLGASALGLTATLSPLSQSVTREPEQLPIPLPPQPQFALPRQLAAHTYQPMSGPPFYSISPNVSESGESAAAAAPGLMTTTPLPVTPITPAHGYGPGVFQTIDYAVLGHDYAYPGAVDAHAQLHQHPGHEHYEPSTANTTPTQYSRAHKTPEALGQDAFVHAYEQQAYAQQETWH
ncbi:hypothetical protein Q5752_003530 [Cryptotrichosporon argae]